MRHDKMRRREAYDVGINGFRGMLLAVLIGMGGAACDSGDPQLHRPFQAIIGDAQPMVVELPPGVPHWTAESEPLVRIGAVVGEEPYQFSRIVFAAELSDDRIVVADGQSLSIRYFDSDGRYLFRTGGRGGGPGEFNSFGRILLLPGDTLLIYDEVLRRLTWIAPDASVSTTESVDAWSRFGTSLPVAERRLLAAFPDSRFAIGFYSDPGNLISQRIDGDTLRLPYYIVISDVLAERVDTLAIVPGILRRLSVTNVPSPAGAATVHNPVSFPSQLTGSVLAAGSHRKVVVSRSDWYELNVFQADGSASIIRRADVSPRPLNAAILADYEYHFYQVITARADGSRDDLLGSPLPTHSAILIDDADRIWVREPEPVLPTFSPEYSSPSNYVLFRPDGQIEAVVSLPDRLLVHHLGQRRVVGVMRDDFGVEHVAVFRISPDPIQR
jgi:hypothetical protein